VISVRRAAAGDVEWLAELYGGDDVDPFLGPRAARGREEILADVERSEREPLAFGRFVIEADGERAGAFGFHQTSEANAIAQLESLAVHPAFRGRRIADDAAKLAQRLLLVELGYHRIELACYAFNERAIAHAERSGFVREGVKRRAYQRHGEWQDAVLFALLREDLDDS
jgi:RimJ/RimL family protein N-acetyltransferase